MPGWRQRIDGINRACPSGTYGDRSKEQRQCLAIPAAQPPAAATVSSREGGGKDSIVTVAALSSLRVAAV